MVSKKTKTRAIIVGGVSAIWSGGVGGTISQSTETGGYREQARDTVVRKLITEWLPAPKHLGLHVTG